jgi:hypothetical protein
MEHLNRFTTDVRRSRRTGFTDDERETSMSDDFIAIETFNDDPDANSDVR